MLGRSPPKREWRFVLSSDDSALLRSLLPAEDLSRPRAPIGKWLWLLLPLPPLLAAGAALFHVLRP